MYLLISAVSLKFLKRIFKLIFFTNLIGLVLLFSFCQRSSDQIVARIGDEVITLKEFRLAYLEILKQPDKFDSPELREAFLQEMINRRLLAKEAKKQRLDRDERFRLKSEAFRNKCLREAHYRHVIEPQITVDDSLLQEIFQYTREERHVRHLYFETKAQADSALALLRKGVPFENLARKVFTSSKLAENGGDLGWVRWDQMEYDMAMTAFRLKQGEISPPVRSSHGYHILQVLNWKKNPLVSKQEFELAKEKLEFQVRAKIGDWLAFQHIEKMMNGLDVQVDPRALKIVGEHLKKIFQNQNQDSARIGLKSISPEENDSLQTSVWEIRNQGLFFINGKKFTVGQFISNLSYLPASIVRRSLKTALDYSIRDFQLTEEAKNLQLDEKDSEYPVKTKLFDEYLLQTMLRKRIIENIHVSEQEIEQKFREIVKQKLPDEMTEEDRDVIRRFIERDKRATAVPEFISSLRQRIKIEIYPEVIHDYYQSLSR
ncbi:MAG: hypothetical protein GXO74_01340 [Calditrichaeota bacterium]|nr:hypothetical protein [Calditrichota bacterium]